MTIVKELSGNSKKKTINALRMILDDAVRALYIQVNPARLATIPKEIPVNPKRALTIYEQKTLCFLRAWNSALQSGEAICMQDSSPSCTIPASGLQRLQRSKSEMSTQHRKAWESTLTIRYASRQRSFRRR